MAKTELHGIALEKGERRIDENRPEPIPRNKRPGS
jgi:hypothetical protein